MSASNATFATRLGAAALCAAMVAGCSWHRVGPRLERPPTDRVHESAGLTAADADTSLADLQAIARAWSGWQTFERVQFPYRAGDEVDLVVELRLRQRVDIHQTSNIMKAVLAGLSLGLLSPVVGTRITEIHEVGVRCIRGAASVGPVQLQVSTDVVIAYMADAAAATKELDDEHIRRVASEVVHVVTSACSSRDTAGRGPAAHGSRQPRKALPRGRARAGRRGGGRRAGRAVRFERVVRTVR